MAQDLLSISQESFQIQLATASIGFLKTLNKDLYELIPTLVDKVPFDKVLDLERKQTKVMAELQRRGYLTLKDSSDYYRWLYSRRSDPKVK